MNNPMQFFTERPKPDPYERPFNFKRLMQVCFPNDYQNIKDWEEVYLSFDYYRNERKLNNEDYLIEMEVCSDLIRFAIGKLNNDKFAPELKAELSRLGEFMLDDTRFSHGGGYFEEKEIWGMIHLLELLEKENDRYKF